MTVSRDLVAAAIRIAADASNAKASSPLLQHDRTLIKRSHVEDLRKALDRAGYADDWRTLHQVVRIEERQPPELPV